MALETHNYHEMRKDDLIALAQEQGIEGASQDLKKDEIIKLIQTADSRQEVQDKAENEEYGTVTFVGMPGQVCDDLLPYQEDQAELVPDTDYTAPVSVIERLVLNSAFQPADDLAREALARQERASQVGLRRARRLLAGPAESGEAARAFDRRMGIAERSDDQVAAQVGMAAEPERPEFDPAEDLLAEDEEEGE